MDATLALGMGLLLLGAVCGGCFGLPSKFAGKDTPWETLWGPFFLFVTVLIPTAVFPLIADGLFATVAEAGLKGVAGPVLFGFLWGLGSMALGLSFAFIGLSLAYAINYGAQIAFGGMGPFLIHNADQLLTPHGAVISAGVLVCLAGVVLCGRAALLREASQKAAAPPAGGDAPAAGRSMMTGLVIALASGALCACFGLAASYGGKVSALSDAGFHTGWRSAFVVCALILWGGSLSACGFCAYKLFKNDTWGTFAKPGIGRILAVALLMALLHDGAILFFLVGAAKIGELVGVGYAVFMSFAIIVGNVNGFLTGEWKGASRRSVAWLVAGFLVLVGGVSVLTAGNAMHAKATAMVLKLDNGGGLAHGGHRIIVYANSTYEETAYSDAVGDGKTAKGTCVLDLNAGRLELRGGPLFDKTLVRVAWQQDEYWVADSVKERIADPTGNDIRRVSLKTVR